MLFVVDSSVLISTLTVVKCLAVSMYKSVEVAVAHHVPATMIVAVVDIVRYGG